MLSEVQLKAIVPFHLEFQNEKVDWWTRECTSKLPMNFREKWRMPKYPDPKMGPSATFYSMDIHKTSRGLNLRHFFSRSHLLLHSLFKRNCTLLFGRNQINCDTADSPIGASRCAHEYWHLTEQQYFFPLFRPPAASYSIPPVTGYCVPFRELSCPVHLISSSIF